MTTIAALAASYNRLNDERETLDQSIITAVPVAEKDELMADMLDVLEQLYDVVHQLATIRGVTLADVRLKAMVMLKLEASSPDTMALAWSIAEDLTQLAIVDPAPPASR